jgi:hypothetical protein
MKWRHALVVLLVATLVGCAAQGDGHAMSDDLSETLVLENGDGDASWLHQRHLVQHISPGWFSGRMGDWYGSALLFRVLGPNHVGEFVALTPRTQATIADQLRTDGVASVVVHRFSCDAATLERNGSCESTATGMTVLRKQDDTRFPE